MKGSRLLMDELLSAHRKNRCGGIVVGCVLGRLVLDVKLRRETPHPVPLSIGWGEGASAYGPSGRRGRNSSWKPASRASRRNIFTVSSENSSRS